MAAVVALTSFQGWLKRDELGPRPKDRLGKPLGEEHGVADGLPAPGQPVKDGEMVKIHVGQRLDSNHPAVKKWPEMFGAPEPGNVEQATRAPGERRS